MLASLIGLDTRVLFHGIGAAFYGIGGRCGSGSDKTKHKKNEKEHTPSQKGKNIHHIPFIHPFIKKSLVGAKCAIDIRCAPSNWL